MKNRTWECYNSPWLRLDTTSQSHHQGDDPSDYLLTLSWHSSDSLIFSIIFWCDKNMQSTKFKTMLFILKSLFTEIWTRSKYYFFILEVRWRNFIFHNWPHFMLPIPSLNCSICNQLSTKLCNKMHKHKIKYSHKCHVHFWSLYISHICLNTSIIYVMANTDPIYLMFAKAEFNLDILGIKS